MQPLETKREESKLDPKRHRNLVSILPPNHGDVPTDTPLLITPPQITSAPYTLFDPSASAPFPFSFSFSSSLF